MLQTLDVNIDITHISSILLLVIELSPSAF
jgi:hypothetical protein